MYCPPTTDGGPEEQVTLAAGGGLLLPRLPPRAEPVTPTGLAQFISRRLRFWGSGSFPSDDHSDHTIREQHGLGATREDFCQTVQRMTDGFTYSLETNESPYRCQNMGRSGALTTSRL